MDENTSLINIGELSRPATALIEKISDAVGGIFKPYQVVRIAKAEAHADRIRAESQIEISDLQRRAFHRFLNEEGVKQKNIEEITQQALPLLTEESKPIEVDDDWLTHFFDRCRLVSDHEMQSLWSRVLAGEANDPGKYSKRTVNFLSGLDKNEAEWFTAICNLCWKSGANFHPFLYRRQLGDVYARNGINGTMLRNLESIGLITISETGFLDKSPKRNIEFSYFGNEVLLTRTTTSKFNLGSIVLTKVGKELAPICGGRPIDGYFEGIISFWRDQGHIVEQTGDAESPEQ